MDSTCKAHEYVELPKLLNDAIVYLENKIDDYQIDMIDEDEKTIPANTFTDRKKFSLRMN